MKWRRQRSTGRQPRERSRDGDRPANPASYSYYTQQRSEEVANTGRQLNRVVNQAKTRAGKVGHFWLQKFGLVILIAVSVICLVSVLSLSSNAKILPVSNTTSLADQANYQAAADKLLSGSIWNHNKITIDTGAIRRQLLKQFPELTSVSVTLPLVAHRPLVYVQTAQPGLVLATDNGRFVIGTSGKVLERLSGGTSSDLPVVTDQSALPATLGHQAMSNATVSFIQLVLYELKAKGITVSNLTLPAHAQEFDVQISGQPYFVKFNLASADAQQQVGTYLATLHYLQTKATTPQQYVDVRVDGRAYYK